VQLLSDVPFAALRKPNSLVGEGYLIQSHTISVTPSLRILQQCNERLKELDQDVLLDTSIGTIIAIGDPAYKERKHNKATGTSERLKGTGEEVEFIEKLFGKEHVVKLMGTEATPSKVLEWAKHPSESGDKQVLFHIAAHGIGQDDGKKVKKGAIRLVSPSSPVQQNYGKLGISKFLVTSKANMLTFFYMYMVGCHTQIDYNI
jgi:CHAT domain-containing protein